MSKEVNAGSIFVEVIAKLDKLDAGMEDAKRKIQSSAAQTESIFTNTFSKLKNIGATLGLAFGTYELFSFTKEAIVASAKLEVLRANFKGTAADIELFTTATAGTVSEANLIKLSNQATDLGISLQDQAILFSLAEDAADKYGTSVEEGMTKVIAASEGSTKGLKALGIQKAVYENIVKSLAKAEGDLFKNLDAETQKQIQVQAILKATGTTIEDVKNKLPDANDKIEQFYVGVEELKTGFGEIIREGLPQFIELLGGVATNTLPAIEAQNELNRAIQAEISLRKMQKDLYKDTVNYVGDLAEKEGKGKSSSQLSDMIANVQEKITRMKKFANEHGFTDDTKNDLDQQVRRLEIYQSFLDAMKEKDKERNKKLQEQKDKDLQIEKEYYASVSAAGLASLEQTLKNVETEIREKYNKLSEAAKKEVDLAKWIAAEKKQIEDDLINKAGEQIEKEIEIIRKKRESKEKQRKGNLLSAETLGPTASEDENPFSRMVKDIDREFQTAQNAAELFASTISSGFMDGIRNGENFGNVLGNLAIKMAEMVVQAGIFAGIMAIANPSNPLGFIGFFGKFLGLASGGPVSGNRPYIIGEKGPELFVPNTAGYVVPNNMLGSIQNYSSNKFTFDVGPIVNAIRENAGTNKNISHVTIPIYLDGKEIAKSTTKYQNGFNKGNVSFQRG